jgi:hypothetical protein
MKRTWQCRFKSNLHETMRKPQQTILLKGKSLNELKLLISDKRQKLKNAIQAIREADEDLGATAEAEDAPEGTR